jgi:diguanylate cyclase (GGDEF)-like protein
MKLLIAEDDSLSRRILLEHVREWGYEPVLARDGQEAWNILNGEAPPPLVILDWIMPFIDGIEICRKLRAEPKPSYIYIIMLTSKNQTEDMVAAIDAGADDFVAKPCDKQELRVRLRAGQRIVELEEQLRYKATHDALTGAINRSLIIETLQRELARGARSGTSTGLLMADLDQFKKVNDQYGHLVGDSVLQEVARRLSGRLRFFDALGRYGGEEFLVVLPECNRDTVLDVAERLRRSIAEEPFVTAAGPLPVTMSVGAAVVPPEPGQEAVSWLHAADVALYRAKQSGRNCVIADWMTLSR